MYIINWQKQCKKCKIYVVYLPTAKYVKYASVILAFNWVGKIYWRSWVTKLLIIPADAKYWPSPPPNYPTSG